VALDPAHFSDVYFNGGSFARPNISNRYVEDLRNGDYGPGQPPPGLALRSGHRGAYSPSSPERDGPPAFRSLATDELSEFTRTGPGIYRLVMLGHLFPQHSLGTRTDMSLVQGFVRRCEARSLRADPVSELTGEGLLGEFLVIDAGRQDEAVRGVSTGIQKPI
jgi:hypothetical protein